MIGGLFGWRMKFALGLIVVSLIGLAAIRVNHALFYEPVEAQVSSISSECYFESKTYMVVAERTTTSEGRWPCTDIESVRGEVPEFADMYVKGKVSIDFTYVSPADKQSHSGSLTFDHEDFPTYAAKGYGETVTILAHQSDPESVVMPD